MVGENNNRLKALQEAWDGLGFELIDKIKAASKIAIISSRSDLVEPLVKLITLHTRSFIHVLSAVDASDIVQGSIIRSDELRMPISRPRMVMEADFVIVIAPMPSNVKTRTEFSIEHFLFNTWFAPSRYYGGEFVRNHDPWLEGDLRNMVLADLYSQKIVNLALLDGVNTNQILASFDPIALDTVGMRMMGIDSSEANYLWFLAGQGLGTNVLSKIDVPLNIISSF